MTLTKTEILNAIKQLSTDDQDALLDVLMVEATSQPLSSAWKAELQRRWSAVESDPKGGISLGELDRRVRGKFFNEVDRAPRS